MAKELIDFSKCKFVTGSVISLWDCSPIDAQLLARVASRDGGSPAMELFKDMNGRGKTAWELHQLAQQCRLQAVCDVIVQGVRSELSASTLRREVHQTHLPPQVLVWRRRPPKPRAVSLTDQSQLYLLPRPRAVSLTDQSQLHLPRLIREGKWSPLRQSRLLLPRP